MDASSEIAMPCKRRQQSRYRRVRRATQRVENGIETPLPLRSVFGAASQTVVINHLIFRQCPPAHHIIALRIFRAASYPIDPPMIPPMTASPTWNHEYHGA